MFCVCAAASASSARFSMKALLSALVFLLTSLSSSEYLLCSCSFSRWDLASFSFFFVAFLSSIVVHVSDLIHSSFFFLLYPKSFLLVSISAWLKLSMFNSCSSWSMRKRFFKFSWKAYSVFGFFNFPVSNRRCISSLLCVFRSFKDNVATTSTWSLPTSAPRLALTSWSDRLHFWLTITWSIWLTVLLSGDLQVVLWMFLCLNRVPPMTRLFSTHRSESLSPLLFMHPKPSVPMALSLPVFSSPTLAFRSPTTMSTSCRGVIQISSSNWS